MREPTAHEKSPLVAGFLRMGDEGLETSDKNAVFYAVKCDDGSPVVPLVVPLCPMPDALGRVLSDSDAEVIEELTTVAQSILSRREGVR